MPITTTPSGGPQGEFSTYTPIYSTTLSATTASVTFSNIPTTYTDLVIVMSPATTHTLATFPYMRFNSDSGSNYSYTEVNGNGTSATSFRDVNQTIGWTSPQMASISNTLGDNTTIANIMNYSNATTYKTYLSRANRAGSTLDYQGVETAVGLWRNTAAITSVLIGNRRGGVDYNFAVGSTFTLYGIKAAVGAPKATGGDVITTDGTYWYHAFKSTSIFDVKTPITVEYLVVAGGGGGGANANDRGSGGGGAGGYRTATAQSLTVQSYPVIVGAGGVPQNVQGSGTKGGNSSFNGMSSTGGGFGTNGSATGGTGGSGGGSSNGGIGSSGNATGGAGNEGGYTPVEGYAGGNSIKNNDGYNGGGGGGAGGAGANASAYSSSDTAGGLGVAPGSNWASATGTGVSGYYAAGGAGAGATRTGNRTDATANTGNGGAGNAQAYRAGAGGSGLVIVRYAV
jgi:hypothetical protein